ncbi:hypothetical protein A2U01_0075415, partial [Trifolium medium]|nr:hypothetical protein [Trifolium medium]
MTETDVQDIKSHGNVGIRPYQMYGLYNQLKRQRKLIASDASAAMKYLYDLGKKYQL